MYDVVVIGGINTDHLVRGASLPTRGGSLDGDVYLRAAGGKGANAAVAAARLGGRTALVGCVGADDRGSVLTGALVREGVDVRCVRADGEAPTGAAVVQVDRTGTTQVLAALGANLRLRVADIERAADVIESARVVLMQLEIPVACAAAAVRIARNAGCQVVLDPAPPRDLPEDVVAAVDVIRANAEEAERLSGVRVRDRTSARRAARALLARGAGAVVVHAGEGNLLVTSGGDEWFPHLPVVRVDTTGAGDAFSGALAAALAAGWSLDDACRAASAAAALATTALGAQAGLPRREDLFSYLDRVGA